MYFVALATDYDGTLAEDGIVDKRTLQALESLRKTGRKLLLATGRELGDLALVFPRLDLFHSVVAENGALLYNPATKEEELLAARPPQSFIDRLHAEGVSPVSVGRVIVATWEPNETAVLAAIRDLGLELQIIFNKGAVMVLPATVNKATGLRAALDRLGLSPHNVVAIGDAENDHAFLAACGCGVAVENALDSIKAKADFVTKKPRGAGVRELVRRLSETDLREPRLFTPRAKLELGVLDDGAAMCLEPFSEPVLIAGSSGGGKTKTVTALLEKMRDLELQFCVVDPEGDYAEFEGAVAVGGAKQPPRLDEVMSFLARPDVSVVVNLLGVDAADRPGFFAKLMPELSRLRAETGRPHWLVIDEAHHMLPAKWKPAPLTLPRDMPATILLTVHPEEIAAELLEAVETVVAVGESAGDVVLAFCRANKLKPMKKPSNRVKKGRAYVAKRDGSCRRITLAKPEGQRQRHQRKYAEGELGEDKSFYFRGPEDALNLRAQNLTVFLQMAEGVDDETWLHHLRAGDYSEWFETMISDDDLAREAKAVEGDRALSPAESRERIKEIVDRRYTAPAKAG